MSDALIQSSKKVLDPMDRMSELLFGLIMALTVIGSVSVVSDGRTDVGAMLVAAFGVDGQLVTSEGKDAA